MEKLFQRSIRKIEWFGQYCEFTAQSIYWSFRRPFRMKLLVEQIERIGMESIPIIFLSSLAIGMIFSLQVTDQMAIFNAEILVGAGVAMTMGRELAPVVTAMMLIAKNGSSMTAEIGTMRVTEQIDAIETMSVNPIHYLAVPRIAASLIVFPVLTAMSNVVGIMGSYIVAILIKGVSFAGYMDQLKKQIDPVDIYSGILKAVVLGFLVATISCFYGYHTRGGSKGVGEYATRSVVVASMTILVADYIMTDLMLRGMY